MAIRNVVTRGYGAGASIPFVVTRGYSISLAISVAITGDTALTETDVRADGKQTIFTLLNDTWQAAGTAFNQVRQIILNGVTSAQTEATGWNKEVRDKESIVSVVRTSNTVVTITWTAASDYDVTVNEVITVTVPDEALNASVNPLIATPTIGVTADAPILLAHIVKFSSVSRLVRFSSTQRRVTFSSASRTIKIVDTPNPLGFILTEDDGIILQEDDLPIALE